MADRQRWSIRWLTAGRYYQLNLVSGDHKNPEYRIADDVRIATEAPVDFVTGVTHGAAVGRDVHRRAVDDWRRADASASAACDLTSRAFW